eukprot:7305478-Prymnesium_polylepis.2
MHLTRGTRDPTAAAGCARGVCGRTPGPASSGGGSNWLLPPTWAWWARPSGPAVAGVACTPSYGLRIRRWTFACYARRVVCEVARARRRRRCRICAGAGVSLVSLDQDLESMRPQAT